jgi:hypothetical protein
VPITTKVVSSNPARDNVYSIQHFGIKFVSDVRQVGVICAGTPVNWPPRYNRNVVESGVKHHKPKPPCVLLE